MKILQIHNFHYRKGGAEVVYLNTIALLNGKGHDAIAFSLKSDENTKDFTNEYFVDTKSLLHNKFYSFEAIKKIEQLIENEKPDIAHFHNIIGGISFSILPVIKKHNIPVVASFHGFRFICPVYVFQDKQGEICDKCSVNRYYYCILKNCSAEGYFRSNLLAAESYLRDFLVPFKKYINRYIFVSHFTKDKFLESHPDIRDKSEVLYNFTQIFPGNINRGSYFLYFGRLGREKGLFTLLAAFAKNPDAKLIMAGDGELKEELLRIKTPNVELVGHKEGAELQLLVKNSSFVVISSECLENNPMTILEGFAMGKPAIGASIGGIPELIEDGKTGFTFEPKNAAELSEIIDSCNNLDEAGYGEMSKASLHFAEKNFSPDSYYSKLMNIYKTTIELYNK